MIYQSGAAGSSGSLLGISGSSISLLGGPGSSVPLLKQHPYTGFHIVSVT